MHTTNHTRRECAHGRRTGRSDMADGSFYVTRISPQLKSTGTLAGALCCEAPSSGRQPQRGARWATSHLPRGGHKSVPEGRTGGRASSSQQVHGAGEAALLCHPSVTRTLGSDRRQSVTELTPVSCPGTGTQRPGARPSNTDNSPAAQTTPPRQTRGPARRARGRPLPRHAQARGRGARALLTWNGVWLLKFFSSLLPPRNSSTRAQLSCTGTQETAGETAAEHRRERGGGARAPRTRGWRMQTSEGARSSLRSLPGPDDPAPAWHQAITFNCCKHFAQRGRTINM